MKIIFLVACGLLLTFSVTGHSKDAQSSESGDPAETEAERVVRIQGVIESDRARLADLKKELKQREDEFERLANDLTKREEDLKVLQARLEETTDAAERAALQAEIDADREKLEVVKSLADLALQVERTVRGQVETLEAKIGIDQRGLDAFLGTAEEPEKPLPATAPGTPQPPPAAPSQPLPGMMPGIQVPSSAPGAAPELVQEILPETAEQVEARQQAERIAIEAEQAERVVLNFLERKAALQEQIDLEKSLLATAEQSKISIDQGVQIRRTELSEAISAGADQRQIQEAEEKLASIEKAVRAIDDEIDKREDTLEAFYERMQALQDEQLTVIEEAKRKRDEAAAALKQSAWLESPLNPTNIIRWARNRGPSMLAVVIVAGVLLVLTKVFVQRVARAMVGKGRRERRNAATRADTLALSFGSAATVIIVVIGVLLVLEAAGVKIATILGGAAILGVAIAFGAQNLMRDYFNGFIILIEDQYELNDLVTINDITGRVERVSLRTTALRDLKGKLHFVPNGEITSVTNRSYEWAQIVFEIRVSYKEKVDQVMDEILSVARQVCAEPEFKGAIIDEPQMLGVDEFAEFGVIIKCLLRTEPNELFRVKREVLRRIKNRFDELGIEIPVPAAAAVASP